VVQTSQFHRFLRKLRKFRDRRLAPPATLTYDAQGQAASDAIRNLLVRPGPCMISRFGNNELRAVLNHLGVQDQRGTLPKLRAYLKGEMGPWWWDSRIAEYMFTGAGFFPNDAEYLERFALRALEDCRKIDLLGSWLPDERRLGDRLAGATFIPMQEFEPYFHGDPWTQALEGRKVLLVHPFEKTIQTQFGKRRLLFQDPRVLPDFELLTLRAVQSIGGEDDRFANWFEALDWMCGEISKLDFDIAIIGAGAYGMSLAAHIKDSGKKAFHMGGATQLLFGIRGHRWDEHESYKPFFNEHWVRPLPEETPRSARKVEGACYW